MSNIISVRLNEQEKAMLNDIAMLNGVGISTMIKQIIFEKLEDEYDYKIIKEYEKEKEDGTLEFTPFNELVKELNL